MDLILFRHGIAVERQEWRGKEQDRPLTGKGIKKTRRALKGLLNLRMTPTHLLSSPLARARESAEIAQDLVRPRVTIQSCEELLPDAAPQALYALLASFSADAVVMCIGHEPHLSLLAGSLLVGKPCAGLTLKKAGACLIHLERVAQAASGYLEWWLTSGQLRALA